MSGSGIGGTLGGLLGAALAPETGGLSLAIPALAGAAGAAAGGALTGDKHILKDALMGGITSGLGAGINSLAGDATGIAGSLNGSLPSWLGGAADTSSNLIPNALEGISGTGTDIGLGSLSNAGTGLADAGYGLSPSVASQFGQAISGAGNAATTGAAAGSAINGALGAANPSILSNIGQWASKNPLQAAVLGNTALTGIQALIPKKQVDVGQNRANVLATDPNFSNPNLPAYHVQNTATPYTGDWYKYGETPQTPLYNGQLVPGYAHGGRVKGYAQGGAPMPMPQMGAQQPQLPVNPLTVKMAHNVGVAIGKHLKNSANPLTPHGKVNGAGGGQDDAIPAKLSQGEYIVPSEVVSQLGDGSTDAGAKKLDGMVHKVRMHKTGKKSFPPKAHNPLAYIKKGSV